MSGRWLGIVALSAAAMVAGSSAEGAGTRLPAASAAVAGSRALVPYGWVDFCGRRPAECAVERLPASEVHLTAAAWDAMGRINLSVNRSIVPVTNWDHWGTMLDHWDYPTDGKGDCKVYALQKRRLLMEAGFPRQSLLMTIVRDLDGEGHTILTVKTDRGDFVLDNMSDRIRAWDATGYAYVKRQSQEDPNVWLDLREGRTAGDRTAAAEP